MTIETPIEGKHLIAVTYSFKVLVNYHHGGTGQHAG